MQKAEGVTDDNAMEHRDAQAPSAKKSRRATVVEQTRPKTKDGNPNNNKPMLTVEDWTELHEFDAWLQTSDAMLIRKEHIHKDKQVLKDLMVHPPSIATLQSAGLGLQVDRKQQPLVLWHYRCFQEALQRFRRWRNGYVQLGVSRSTTSGA